MKKLTSISLQGKPSRKEREYFISNLAVMLNSTVTVGQTIDALRETSTSRATKKALAEVAKKIEEGSTLTNALRDSGMVSIQSLALMSIGEQSGNLITNLKIAAAQEEKQHILRSKVHSSLMYPAFVLVITGVVGLGIAWFLLPKLSETFGSLDMELPAISQVMINLGFFLRDSGIWAMPLLIGFIAAIFYVLFVHQATKHIGQAVLLKIPVISNLIKQAEIARFCYLLGTLIDSGLPITRALLLLSSSTTLRPYLVLYRELGSRLDEGYGLYQSLSKSKSSKQYVPLTVQRMIASAETSGVLAQTLLDIGRVYEEKTDSTARNLQVIIEPILLIIVWLAVLAVAIAVILPIYSLVGGLDA